MRRRKPIYFVNLSNAAVNTSRFSISLVRHRFCGFEIAVNRHVLVPRPETEILAELGWEFLSTFHSQPSTALDFCTGSGCIAIAIAAKCPDAKIIATDISTDALTLAGENATQNKVAERIKFLQSDGFRRLAEKCAIRFNHQQSAIYSNR
ncbi:MAG: HemK family protein methyltransferase [Limisphaerales bacterium]